MEVKIVEEEKNPLLERRQIRFKVGHSNAPTPPRSEVRKELASVLEVPEDNLVIEKMATLHGTQSASGIARVYETEEHLKEMEPKHLIERAKAEPEKEEKAEKEEPEEKAEKEVEEEPPEEPEEEETEEKGPEEEADEESEPKEEEEVEEKVGEKPEEEPEEEEKEVEDEEEGKNA